MLKYSKYILTIALFSVILGMAIYSKSGLDSGNSSNNPALNDPTEIIEVELALVSQKISAPEPSATESIISSDASEFNLESFNDLNKDLDALEASDNPGESSADSLEELLRELGN